VSSVRAITEAAATPTITTQRKTASSEIPRGLAPFASGPLTADKIYLGPMSAPSPVRRATQADLPALTSMLTRAFHDDPIAIWACPHERERPRMLERFHGTRLKHLLPHGEVWTTPECESAALWAPPEAWKTSGREDLELTRCMLTPRLLVRAPLVGFGLLGIERKHPHNPPHWYLATLGTDPSAQGRGLGSAVLAPILEQCDRDGVDAYLESSKERNLDFYARFGFRATDTHRLPRGPQAWPMWRDPLS
jgi:GNAT superfamily N-acetyltransferase